MLNFQRKLHPYPIKNIPLIPIPRPKPNENPPPRRSNLQIPIVPHGKRAIVATCGRRDRGVQSREIRGPDKGSWAREDGGRGAVASAAGGHAVVVAGDAFCSVGCAGGGAGGGGAGVVLGGCFAEGGGDPGVEPLLGGLVCIYLYKMVQ